MPEKQREGIVVDPDCRLSDEQVRVIDGVSRELLQDPGLFSYSAEAAGVFKGAGAKVEDAGTCVRVRIPSKVIDGILKTAPSTVVLGARNPDNRLVLNAHEPRVRFGSGSETNVWLHVEYQDGTPRFERRRGSIQHLREAAHLCQNLENLDFFIRCVNIQDQEVTGDNKDVNKFFHSLDNTTKHVQAGLTSLQALDDVIRIGQIIAGGKKAFEESPVLSFITCVIKSPLQVVEPTASKLIEISKRRVPVVISSCPMGGATAPFDEFGMVAQVNAEVLAGVALNQLVSPGAPVLYGAVPVRTRLDNLNDMYGAPEVNHYAADCVQMARSYGLPCYSTAGVGDTDVPGIQANTEKLLTLLSIPRSGAHYVHYAFGLLERTNVFCPEQAVLDDAHIGLVKYMLRPPQIAENRREDVLALVREVMDSDHQTYVYNLPLPSREPVYVRYPLESEKGGALYAAHLRYHEILKLAREALPAAVQKEIEAHIPNILSGAPAPRQ